MLILTYQSIRKHDFFCFKDRVPKYICAYVVYEYSCSSRNSTSVNIANWLLCTSA